MKIREELLAYRTRWDFVDKVIQEERKIAPLALRWQQLNSAFAIGQALGFRRDDASESTVFDVWTKIKAPKA